MAVKIICVREVVKMQMHFYKKTPKSEIENFSSVSFQSIKHNFFLICWNLEYVWGVTLSFYRTKYLHLGWTKTLRSCSCGLYEHKVAVTYSTSVYFVI